MSLSLEDSALPLAEAVALVKTADDERAQAHEDLERVLRELGVKGGAG